MNIHGFLCTDDAKGVVRYQMQQRFLTRRHSSCKVTFLVLFRSAVVIIGKEIKKAFRQKIDLGG